MSVEADCEFIDSNILVYAYDSSAGVKQTVAAQLLSRLWDTGAGCLSVQVLQEFFSIVTRKVPQPLSVDAAADRVRDFACWKVFSPTAPDVLAAIALHKKPKISFWDAMIVHSAAELGRELLWTEDLQHESSVQGLRIHNPFMRR